MAPDMTGSASATSARTSAYHTAHSSPDPVSPLSFWTPAPPRDNVFNDSDGDTTPRAAAFRQALEVKDLETMGSSPILQRYMDHFTTEQQASAVTPVSNTPRTRLQARLKASQSSSARSTPAPPSTVTRARTPQARHNEDTPTIRASSPLTRSNMLRDIFPQSASYSAHVEGVVKEVMKSLASRGRAREGHALEELYKQSFKDPGTAELLDALLRQRANERQKRDFKRYVEDVNVIDSQGSAVVKSRMLDITGEGQKHSRNASVVVDETVVETLPADFITPPSPRVVIEAPSNFFTGELMELPAAEVQSAIDSHSGQETQSLARTSQDTISESTISASQSYEDAATRPDILRSPHQHREDVVEQLLPVTDGEEGDTAHEHYPVQLARSEMSVNPSKAAKAQTKTIPKSGMILQARDSKAVSRPSVTDKKMGVLMSQSRRRRKSRKRLFSAANGPVYSRTLAMPSYS